MTNAASLDLPDRARKRMAVLGHHVALWSEALTSLRGRLEKGKLPEPLAAHVRLAFAQLALEPSPTALSVKVHCPDANPEDWILAETSEPACVSPAARALLHLPGLRRVWAGWLRASVLADLTQRLPCAWVVDHTALPPHAAIAGLGISAWADLVRLRTTGRAFRVGIGDETLDVTASTDAGVWQQTAQNLAAASPGSALVSELPVMSGTTFRADYAQEAKRWEMVSLSVAD